MMKQGKIHLMIGGLVLLLIGGCATADPSLPSIDFIQDGITSRGAVINAMGPPSMTLEYATLLTYRLRYSEDQNEYQIVARQYSGAGGPGWKYADISLVLIFDENGILERHSMVRVK